jgi:archaellum component FlaF (FlaF/FlaG flagellin family)
MGYTVSQINDILLKADKTVYKLGSVAYDNMFAELDEVYDYERDIIYIYKKAVEYADDFYVGTVKLDQVVERLAAKLNIYDYGSLSPIYVDVSTQVDQGLSIIYVLRTTVLDLGPGMTGSTDFSQSQIDIDLDFAYIKEQTRDYYLHDQQIASASWTITHNLGKFASINIVDTANEEVIGDVTYNSINQITVTFSAPVSGKAYIN